MSKVATIQTQQQVPKKIIRLKAASETSEKPTDSEADSDDTENYYGNIIGQFQTVIVDQYKEIDEKAHKIKVMEKAFMMKNEDNKKQFAQKNADIKDKDIKIKLLEQELEYHAEKNNTRQEHRSNTRKIVQELHDINSKRRNKIVSEAQLDAEAREYLKMFE